MIYYSDAQIRLLKDKLESEVLFLIVTATDIEMQTINKEMAPLRLENDIIKAAPDRNTYYIGRLGRYPVVHVKTTDQGALDRDASIMTVNAALDYWDVSAIIMVGIAFGCDPKAQSIGDVLISTSLRNYEDVKLKADYVEDRSSNPKSGIILLNRFRNISNWEYPASSGNARIHFGEILSGEKLVDNREFRDQLIKRYPMAIGGEMEGYGIYTAAEGHGIQEWIIVKAICDFAENKHVRKHEKQKLAAESACSCIKTVLSEPVFDSLKKKFETNVTGYLIDKRFLENKKLPKEKHALLLKTYMKVNSNLEIVSQIVVNDLDTFDKHQQNLVLDAMMRDRHQLFIIDGNGGEGKTTFAFRIATGLGGKGYLVFFMDLTQQNNTLTRRDVENLISEMCSESNSEPQKSFLFIDNPCANLNILGWIHDAVEYYFSTINIVLVERASRLRMLFNSNANDFPEWEEGAFRICLRNTVRKWEDQAEHKDELWINRSFAMRKDIIEKMLETLEGIDMKIVNTVFRTYLNDLMQDKNMTVVEAMFYLKFKYNEILQEKNLPISKRIPLDWDEWDNLIFKNSISQDFCYGYIAAPYLFSYQFPVYAIIQERPDFLSTLNVINRNKNVEPLIFDKGRGRLYPKHEAIAEMYFHFCNIDNITWFLTKNFRKFSTAMQKSFILRVMRKEYIQESAIGSLNVDFSRILDIIIAEEISVEMADQVALIRYWISCKGDQFNCEELKKLTKQYPNNQDIWKEYISICIQCNDYEECERALKNLLLIDGKGYWTLRFAAETYFKMSNIEQAVKYYYAAAKKSQNRLRDYRRIEKILEETQTVHGLSRVRQRIIEMEYKKLSNYIKLDSALKAEEKTDSCFKNYEYAQYYFPENTWGYEKSIELALQNGYYGKAYKDIRKYYVHFPFKNRSSQAKLLQYWAILCWSDDCYIEKVRQLVLKNFEKIILIWEEEKKPSVLRWILVLCFETGFEHMLPLTNINYIADKDEMIILLSTIASETISPLKIGTKILWPKKFLDAVFNESKVYFCGHARFWHSFIRFVYQLFKRLRDACSLDPYLEKTLYWDMKLNMQKWTFYAMQRFLTKGQSGIDEILSCTVEYEIILFLAPFHWYEKYFEGRSDKAKKLEQIVFEKQRIISYIQKVYTESAKMLLADGQVKKANQLLAEIVKRYPKHITYLVLYITSFIELNDSKAVYQWYLYVLSLPKGSIPNKLFTDTVNYYMGLNDWETIETVIQASEGIISNRRKIKICEMRIYFQKGDFDIAEEIALDIQKEGKPDIESISTLYQIYCKRRDMQQARRMAYFGIEQFPKSDIAYINLADYLYKTGEKEEALQICLKRMNKENPNILKLGRELCCECGQYKNALAFYYRYCKLMRKNKNLKRLPYADIAEGLFVQGKIGLLKRFLKNVRRHYGYEKTVHEYMSKIINKSSNIIIV